MNSPRLLHLAQLLENFEERKQPHIGRFDLTSWTSVDQCGTTACAVGAAAQDPWFNAEGLTASPVPAGASSADKSNMESTSWSAVMAFFDLGEDDAAALFRPEFYDGAATQLDVANRIRLFIGIPRGDDERGDLNAPDFTQKTEEVPCGSL